MLDFIATFNTAKVVPTEGKPLETLNVSGNIIHLDDYFLEKLVISLRTLEQHELICLKNIFFS
jgi:hypothetical protein